MWKYLLIAAALLGFVGQGHAADSTVSGMSAASALDGTELFYGVQGGADRKVTGSQVKTFANTSAVRATTTTSEALVDSDRGKLVTFSNGSAVAATIAQAGGGGNFAAGWVTSLSNLGAGTVTLTPATSTIDGAASLTLTTGQGFDLYSDGTNYFTMRGRASNNASDLSAGTLPAARMPALTGDCVTSAGAVAQKCGYQIAGYVASNWYTPQSGIVNLGPQNGTMAANVIVCSFGAVPIKATISSVAGGVNTIAASGNFQIAIYANANSRPGALIGNSGSMSTGTAATVTGALAANKQIGPGGTDGSSDLWWCTNVDATAGGTVKMTSSANVGLGQGMAALIGSSTASNALSRTSLPILGVSCSGANCTGGSSTFNTWPATLAGSTWTDVVAANVAIVAFQIASVP